MIAYKTVGLLFLSALAPAAAQAGASNGSNALALSAIVGELAPQTSAPNKKLLAAFLSGNAEAPHAKGLRVAVKADAIDCRAGNVDITSRACELTFGAKKIELHGRKAHELYATLIENGVVLEGAAGTTHASITALDCIVDADEVAEKAGGGARCAYNP
ncbi:MAG: hypothetical protein FJX40_08200 [Alphaproteobacteria bacterium]|uniref:hypothetical protein n=1 Tax=Methylocystis sp. B8 TaxID=544938 RepID=UPI0010FEE2D7|nr:hypothetical protein [Methylocystis sp. B8]MBM3577632.1 hypothetical protein [Alphaproteobacteria bacterium]MBM3642025.1 hypothetical protein [Alphaproteobacteria bacterium]TLG76922.1 hypothetical protein FEV16_09295 [Methylocystis sp. B8]